MQEPMVRWEGEKLSKDHRILPVTHISKCQKSSYTPMLALLPLPSQTLQQKMYSFT